jgi:hypothetical protein
MGDLLVRLTEIGKLAVYLMEGRLGVLLGRMYGRMAAVVPVVEIARSILLVILVVAVVGLVNKLVEIVLCIVYRSLN